MVSEELHLNVLLTFLLTYAILVCITCAVGKCHVIDVLVLLCVVS